MITVNVNIVCHYYTKGFRGSECTVPEGSTIREALDICLEQNKVIFNGDIDIVAFCMKNKAQAQFYDVVEDGDEILILRKIFGG